LFFAKAVVLKDMTFLGHKVYLSSGAAIHNPHKTESENLSLYGDDYSPTGMGCNYEIEVQFAATGRAEIQKVEQDLNVFDHRYLNDLVGGVPTLENLAKAIWSRGGKEAVVTRLSVQRGEKSQCVYNGAQDVLFARRFEFSGLHRHNNPELNDQENKDLYGKCSAVHGHEYKLWVAVIGTIDENGLIVSRSELDSVVKNRVVERFHGQFINDVIGNTSGELLLKFIYDEFRSRPPWPLKTCFKLIETKKNSFYSPQSVLF